MTGYQRLAGNAAAVMVGRLLSIGLGVVLATVLFKRLGPEQYGAWSLLTLVSGYSTLIDFGLAAAIERRVATLVANEVQASIGATINTTLLGLSAVVALAELIVVGLVGWPHPIVHVHDDSLRRAILILPICTGATLASLAVGAVLSGQQRMRVLYVWRTLGLAVGTAAAIAAVWWGVRGLDVLLVAYTVGSPITMAMAWRAVRQTLPDLRFHPHWDREAARDVLWFGGVVQVATMVPPLAEYVFRLLVSARFGLEFAGVYDLGARAAVVLRSLAGSLFSAMVPFAVQTERQHGTSGLTRLVRTTGRHVALFILPGTAVLIPFAAPIVDAWLGNGPLVADVERCFVILAIAHAVGALMVPAAMVGRGLGRPAAEAIGTVTAFAAAVIAAQFVPSFEVAVALFWGLPALGGLVAWAWLSRTVGFGFLDNPDVAIALVVAGVTYGVARPLASWADGPMRALVGLSVVALLAACLAGGVEFADRERRVAAARWFSQWRAKR